MFVLLDPQPHHESDVLSWERGNIPGRGLGIANGEMFVPFPGEDMTGVRIIKDNDWWYWARPEFYNVSNPLETIRAELKDLHVFYEYQLAIIANAASYVANNPSGTAGDHLLQLVIAILYELLATSLFHLTDEQTHEVVKRFREWEIQNI